MKSALNDIGLALERAEAVTELLIARVDGEDKVTVAALDAIGVFLGHAHAALIVAEREEMSR